ncbi:MAG: hypothetical protein AB2695_09025, partial [Candidatus Thiodiazotropha endolucinida]
MTVPSGSPSWCINTADRRLSSSERSMASVQDHRQQLQSYPVMQPAHVGLETPESSLVQLPPGWQVIAQTPVLPSQGTKLQEDTLPVTFQTVGVVNPLDAAETSGRPALTSTFSGVP